MSTKRMKKPRTPSAGSLAWYRAAWKASGKGLNPVAIEMLAQLSYENKQIRKRLEAIESVQIASLFGQVEVEGVFHLLECRKRDGKQHPCTCGSNPDDVGTELGYGKQN